MFFKDIQSGYIYHYINFFILGFFGIALFVIFFSVFVNKIAFILTLVFMFALSESAVEYINKF